MSLPSSPAYSVAAVSMSMRQFSSSSSGILRIIPTGACSSMVLAACRTTSCRDWSRLYLRFIGLVYAVRSPGEVMTRLMTSASLSMSNSPVPIRAETTSGWFSVLIMSSRSLRSSLPDSTAFFLDGHQSRPLRRWSRSSEAFGSMLAARRLSVWFQQHRSMAFWLSLPDSTSICSSLVLLSVRAMSSSRRAGVPA